MRYATATGFRAALEERLLATSRQSGRPIVLLRKLASFDRLLARCVAIAPNRWVLKGAVALHYRLDMRLRATKDLDLGRWGDANASHRDLSEACSTNLADHFRFVIADIDQAGNNDAGRAIRYHLTAYVAGRTFEELTIDVGFGPPPAATPEHVTGPSFFEFANILPTPVPILDLNFHVAEKFHACHRMYAERRTSSRFKDLIDIVLIAHKFPFEFSRLQRAIDATFLARDGSLPTGIFPDPPQDWEQGYKRLASEVGISTNLRDAFRVASQFINPVVARELVESCIWDPSRQAWASSVPTTGQANQLG